MAMITDSRPNILLILTDQHRYDTLGCYGASMCRTPHIDRLAKQGVRFDLAYTCAVACSPSRAALFTGLYPHKNNVKVNDKVLNPDVPTLATELGRAGYNLGYAGKWHVDRSKTSSEHGFEGKAFPGYGYPIPPDLVEGLGFSQRRGAPWWVTPYYADYLREHGYAPPKLLAAHYGDNPNRQKHEIYALQSGGVETSFEYMVSEDTIDLLRTMKARREGNGRPFFIWANFWGPHTPCLLPEPYYSMYDPRSIPEEPSFGETWERKPFVQQLIERTWGLSRGGWERWREIVARYWGYVTMIDDLVGRIVTELEALGGRENTLVIFSTDHGDNMGAHRLIEKGPFMYEQCYRLPLVAAHPRCESPGSVCSEFVYLQDLFSTFLELAGVSVPEETDTASILDLILGKAHPMDRDSVYAQFYQLLFPYEQRMVRTRTHKFVYNRSDIGELYDLVNDPWEMHNLIDLPETKSLQDELMGMMREHMVRLKDPVLRAFDRIRYAY